MVEGFNEAKRMFDIKSLAPKVSDFEGAEGAMMDRDWK